MVSNSRGKETLVASTILTAMAAIFIVMRFYTRTILIPGIWLEDWLALITLMIVIAENILACAQVGLGMELHIYDVSPANIKTIFRYYFITSVLYTASLYCMKLSFLFQYRRIFVGQTLLPILTGLTIVVGLYGLISVFVILFGYSPMALFWHHTVSGYCINLKAFWIIHSSVNIVIDLIIWILPMPTLWALHLTLRSRLALMIIFGFGLFVSVLSMVRLKLLLVAYPSTDVTWEFYGTALVTSAEVNVAIICASSPMIKPLIKKIFPSLLGSLPRPEGSSNKLQFIRSRRTPRRTVPDHSFNHLSEVSLPKAIYDPKVTVVNIEPNESSEGEDGSFNDLGNQKLRTYMKCTSMHDAGTGEGSSERGLVFYS